VLPTPTRPPRGVPDRGGPRHSGRGPSRPAIPRDQPPPLAHSPRHPARHASRHQHTPTTTSRRERTHGRHRPRARAHRPHGDCHRGDTMPRSGPQRAWSPRRVMHLPAVAAIVDDRVEREVPVPNPGRLAPPQDVSYPRCRSQPVDAPHSRLTSSVASCWGYRGRRARTGSAPAPLVGRVVGRGGWQRRGALPLRRRVGVHPRWTPAPGTHRV